ncbi:MAG: hypothetical protein DRJ42_03620 [Deltaproteobacteria bacterium]|nr:MAG: hypothetical protein DRJ42_03620 [Deltaproteobacteria bacterium]
MLCSATTARAFALISFLSFLSLAALGPNAAAAQTATDGASLSAALANATAGDVVQIDGHIVGDFTVPAGVTLLGTTTAIIEGAGAGAALTVVPGATTTTIKNLTVVSDGRYGIWVSGAGATHLNNVAVSATRGVGIAGEGTDFLGLRNVHVLGPVTEDNADAVPAEVSPFDTATHGLILLGVEDAVLVGVHVSGFAQAGAIIAASTTAIRRSHFNRNVGTGLVLAAGDTTIHNSSANRTFRGARTEDARVTGLAVGAGANVTTTRMRTINNQGFGVFQDGSGITEHHRLASLANLDGGLWAQDAEYLGVDRASISGNSNTGIAAIDTTYALIADTWVVATHSTSIDGKAAQGDGIVLIDTPGALDHVTLRGNDRVGLLATLDSSSSPDDISLTDVVVAGPRGALGVVFQTHFSILATITEGITRLGQVAANDQYIQGLKGMEIFGTLEPPVGLPTAIELVGTLEPPVGSPARIDEAIFGDGN